MKSNWLMVADEAVAHVYQWKPGSRQLQEVETLTHPAAHAQEGDLRDDAHGRQSQGRSAGGAAGKMSSVASSAGLDQTHGEAIAFARRVAEWLAQAQLDGRFQQLRVAAAPRFLGLLRQQMTPQVAGVVIDELDKNLVHESRADLEKRFLGEQPGS